MWFNLSASHPTEAADRDLAAKNRDELAAKMTPAQIAGAQRLASKWVQRMEVVTVHGFRSSARSWMADNAVPFELGESCLAHAVGNAVVQAYQRSSMLERRRPIMSAWGAYVCGADADNVAPLRRGASQ